MSVIRNIVFDIGKVLFDYSPLDVVTELLPSVSSPQFYVDHFHDNWIWQALDEGRLTPDEAALNVVELAPPELNSIEITRNIHIIINQFHTCLPPILPMIDLFKSVLNHYNVFLLSNFQDKPFDRLCQLHPFLNLAVGAVVSAKEKCMKPNVEIYHCLLNRYAIEPNHTVFIDDRADNIDTAIQLGMHGIVHVSPDASKHQLNRILNQSVSRL
jgi:putative hydrolase of the HAD superfamily